METQNCTIRILVDVDGILAQLATAIVDYLNESHPRDNRSWDVSDITHIDMRRCLPDEVSKDVITLLHSPGFCTSLKPYDDAVERLLKIANQPLNEVWFVTGLFEAGPTWAYERKMWLKRWFGVHAKRVIFDDHKHIQRGDVFLDDGVSHVFNWQQENKDTPNAIGLLWTRPWNMIDTTGSERLTRVTSWDDVDKAIAWSRKLKRTEQDRKRKGVVPK